MANKNPVSNLPADKLKKGGPGRPKGSKTQNPLTKSGRKRLASLGLDPLEAMIDMLYEINDELAEVKDKSLLHYTTLRGHQKDILKYLSDMIYLKVKDEEVKDEIHAAITPIRVIVDSAA